MPNTSIAGARAPNDLVARRLEAHAPASVLPPAVHTLRAVRNTPTPSPWRAVARLFSCASGRHAGDDTLQRLPPRLPTALADVSNAGPSSDTAARDVDNLDAWAREGGPSEHRAELRDRILRFRGDPQATVLDISGLGVRALPTLPPAQVVNALGNPLTHLPTKDLPKITTLWIELDPQVFPPRTQGHLRMRPEFATVTHVHIGAPDPWRDEHIALPLAAAMWFPKERACDIAAAWLPVVKRANAFDFATFLQALACAIERAWPADSRKTMHAHVAAWLAGLREDPLLLENAIGRATRARLDDGDPLLAYFDMQRQPGLRAFDAGHHDADVLGALSHARGLLRQEHVEQIAARKLQMRGDADGIVPALLVGLRDRLLLPHTVPGGSFGVGPSELRRATHEVLQRDTELEASLAAWPPWQRLLARVEPEAFDTARAQMLAWFGDGTVERQVDARLRSDMPWYAPSEQAEHLDLRRDARRVVLDELQYAAYAPVTRALLQRHGHASMSDALKALDRLPARP